MELTTEAKTDNLEQVIDFINTQLEEAGCSMKAQMQIEVAVEELFVNVAHYAYAPNTGNVTIDIVIDKDPVTARITFTDSGIPYDPLAKEDPDVTLSAEERTIGGLGIYMVKKSMDEMHYEYRDGHNVLTICKKL
ncbi:MAG: ATP-binding protein [Lachnospiraceae bacterium]|nr:ATP-binding protein [Lachnospiraceae bacterium]